MSRPYATDEQYERWYFADCCRCGRRKNKAGAWPDGHVCRACADRALRTRGTCPGCGQERVSSRTASLRRGGHLPRLRGLLAVLRLRTMRVRGQAAPGPALHPLRIRRPPGRAAGRRHRPDPPRACPAGRRPARHGQPAIRPDLALPAPGPVRVRRRPAAAPRPGRDTADPRGVQRPPALAGRLPPARPPDGLRRAPGHRQAALRVRAMAGHPPRHRHRQRPCPGHPPLRHLGSPAQAPLQGRKEAAQHGLARLRRRPGTARHRVPPVALRSGALPCPGAARQTSTPGTPGAARTTATPSGPSSSGAWPTS